MGFGTPGMWWCFYEHGFFQQILSIIKIAFQPLPSPTLPKIPSFFHESGAMSRKEKQHQMKIAFESFFHLDLIARAPWTAETFLLYSSI